MTTRGGVGGALVIQGDALHLPLADASVDLVITSPPYLWKRSYAIDGPGELGNERDWRAFLDNLWRVTDELLRVLKPSGSIWVNLGDTRVTGREAKWLGIPPKSLLLLPERYRVGCQDRYAAAGVIVRQRQVLEKSNGLPESVTDRTRDSHEDWVHIVRRPDYYAAIDEIREPHTDVKGGPKPGDINRPDYQPNTQAWRSGGKGMVLTHRNYNSLGKLPGSVWRLPSEPLVIPAAVAHALNLPTHYAAFGTEVVRRIVLGWSPPGLCTVCGQGRFPVVEREAVKSPVHGAGSIVGNRGGGPDERGWDGLPRFNRSATILGYACACCPSTLHPGTGEPSGQHGRYAEAQAAGVYANTADSLGHAGLSARPKVGPWWEHHLAGWQAPPTRPAVVLDPFAGTFTTVMVAHALDRIGIGVDLSSSYCRLGLWRTRHSGHAGKAIARTNQERQGTLL